MSTIDQQFVEYTVKALVGRPEDVVVDRTIDEKGVLLTLTVNPADLGRVIGKRGSTAQSLRTLLRALGAKNDARYNLKIVNNDGFLVRVKKMIITVMFLWITQQMKLWKMNHLTQKTPEKSLQNSTILIYN